MRLKCTLLGKVVIKSLIEKEFIMHQQFFLKASNENQGASLVKFRSLHLKNVSLLKNNQVSNKAERIYENILTLVLLLSAKLNCNKHLMKTLLQILFKTIKSIDQQLKFLLLTLTKKVTFLGTSSHLVAQSFSEKSQ